MCTSKLPIANLSLTIQTTFAPHPPGSPSTSCPTMSFFKDKVIAITGSASGIDRATAETLLAEGAKVYIADLQTSGADSLISTYNGKYIVIKINVSSLSSIQEFFAIIEKSGDRLYGAVNAAGVNLPGKRLPETMDEFIRRLRE